MKYIFEENITHELAHYFYGLTPDVPDATHDLVAMHGHGKWLEHFLNQWTPPQPRESHEANLFMRTLQALLSTFGLNKKEEDAITTVIAEHFPEPKAPIAPAPKKSRVEELARSMEMVETHFNDPKTMGMRYNNPGCLMFANWEKEYGAVKMPNGSRAFRPIHWASKPSSGCCDPL